MDRSPFSLQDAWQHVGGLYAWIVSLFGAPALLAARLMLVRETRRQILEWLGPVEALARRLLLLKALTMPKVNDAPARAAAGKLVTAFTDAPAWTPSENSAEWRVLFRVAPRLERVDRRRTAGMPAATEAQAGSRRSGGVNLNALPLARRLEALRRVLENPAPALARLCRLLAGRRGAVQAAFGPYRPRATPVQSLLPAAQAALELAFNTS